MFAATLPAELHDAIAAARAWAEAHATTPCGAAALADAERDYGAHGVRVQILYIVSNLSGWRGPVAREAKRLMSGWAEEGRRR